MKTVRRTGTHLTERERQILKYINRTGDHLSKPEIKALIRSLTKAQRQAIRVEERTGFHLTGREIEVLIGIADGKSSSGIAKQWGIKGRTAERHRQNMMRKMDMHSVVQLTKFALYLGLTKPYRPKKVPKKSNSKRTPSLRGR